MNSESFRIFTAGSLKQPLGRIFFNLVNFYYQKSNNLIRILVLHATGEKYLDYKVFGFCKLEVIYGSID